MTGRERVFEDQIGNWPKVYATGQGRFEIVASHKDPRRVKLGESFAFVPGLGVAYYFLSQMDGQNWRWTMLAALAGGAAAFGIARSILTDLPFITKSSTVISFDNGTIAWGKHRIPADMPRIFRCAPHRRAKSELRAAQNSKEGNRRPLFQISSEVFVNTGEGWMLPRLVAEIAYDENEEWGHMLSSTMKLVDRESSKAHEKSSPASSRVNLD